MILDLPATTTSKINRSLVDLRASGGAVALGRVLTLVVLTPSAGAEDAIAAATDASREHPMRVLVVVSEDASGDTGLDAQIRVGGDAGAGEIVVLRLAGELSDQGASVVVPLLLPDAPIVAWWPGQAPDDISEDPIGRLAQRRITDAAGCDDPQGALRTRSRHHTDGDTDMAWTRTTRWRALLAAALDLPPQQPVTSAVVRGAADSPSTDLLAAWLHARLDCPVEREVAGEHGMHSVELVRDAGRIVLSRPEGAQAVLSQPGEPDHRLGLPRRSVAECLAEELRRLDPDVTYSEVVRSLLDHEGPAGAAA
ncbi:glucose-6-phosphate dehydrogenase assembly protein OpcA [Aquipuribacter hungaricus]|uniref:Glucose-6-phosphate dehydrogenase assembly protein OpcA n=1 Tax=Aquipuribacter hungaricus TaxID=545624 RepID=A0ABV7WCL3_9MICO